MKSRNYLLTLLLLTALGIASAPRLEAASAPTVSTPPQAVPVRMTVTASPSNGKRLPEIRKEDVVVKRGSERLSVIDWVPAQGNRAGLELFILIDDSSSTRLGLELDDLRAFIMNQAPATAVGIGYNRNGVVQIAQNLTSDHAKAARALRLPLGSPGAYGSPYLSATDLMKRWPESSNRREIVMVTDGLDHPRGRVAQRILSINPRVDTAVAVAQRTGTVIHTIYAPGSGHSRRSYWQARSGQISMAMVSDKTGGESFYLGLNHAVSFRPYLAELLSILDNQYLLTFSAKPAAKAKLQYINLDTELAGVELKAHDAVWVPKSE